MNDLEEVLRLTLNRHAEDAPLVTAMRAEAQRPARRWRTWLLPIVAAACAAVVVALVILVDTSSESTRPASTPDVTQLSGKDVGLALGLEPITGPIDDCDGGTFAEYQNGSGFCLDGVTNDPLEEELLALQIVGYRRTDTLIEYAQAILALHDAQQHSTREEQDRLGEREIALYKQLQQEQPKDSSRNSNG